MCSLPARNVPLLFQLCQARRERLDLIVWDPEGLLLGVHDKPQEAGGLRRHQLALAEAESETQRRQDGNHLPGTDGA